MKFLFAFLLTVSTLFANIATVVDTFGISHIIRDGKSTKVVQKQKLKEHDTIKTGKNAKVKLFFNDNTAVSLGQNTTFEIDSYVFTGKKDSQIKFKVLKGFFKTVTGQIGKIAPNRFKLQTKNATIGIRGTVFAAEVKDSIDVVICTDGKIILFTPDGNIEVGAGKAGSVKKGTKPKAKKYSEKQRNELIKKAGWHGTMSLKKLMEFIKKNFEEPLRSQLLATLQNILNKDSQERELYLGKEKAINADDKSFVDSITINDREFDELPNEVEFYPEDLQDGKVVVKGVLESEDKNTPIESLYVELTTDGGESWSRAKGNKDWEWSFEPELEKNYEFSLRVVQDEKREYKPVVIAVAGEFKDEFVVEKKNVAKVKDITTKPIVLRFKKNGVRVVNTEPIVLKFKKFTPKVITTDPIVIRFKKTNSPMVQYNPDIKEAVTKGLVLSRQGNEPVYEVTIPTLEFKVKKEPVYEATVPTLEFKVKKEPVYEVTIPTLEFKINKELLYNVPLLKIKKLRKLK